jgi:gliding motility-associated-like protein
MERFPKVLFIPAFLATLYSGSTFSQLPPFTCKGQMWVIWDGWLHELRVNPHEQSYPLIPLPNPAGFEVDAIGYRTEDNYIYGIAPRVNQNGIFVDLCRIGSDGRAELLKDSILQSFFSSDLSIRYPSGDISPDGRYLTLLDRTLTNTTYGDGEATQLIFIDLESSDYPIASYPLQIAPLANSILCVDHAFDPLTGQLYSFDGINKKLVAFHSSPGFVNAELFQHSNDDDTWLAGLFFDPFGMLFSFVDRNLVGDGHIYSIDKESGVVVSENSFLPLGTGGTTDGCSCPYTVALQKKVFPDEVFPCTEATYSFIISNLSKSDQSNLVFRDTFPDGFVITEVLYNPFGGMVSGIGGNILTIDHIAPPRGIDSILVKVRIPEDASGVYYNQAVLEGLDLSAANDGRTKIRSDNPYTLEQDDPTPLRVRPLSIENIRDTFELCPGNTVVLHPVSPAAGLAFSWAGGAGDSVLTVRTTGTYPVTVSTACSSLVIQVEVISSPLSVDLGKSLEIVYGDSIEMNPVIRYSSPVNSYSWSSSPPFPLSCPDCPSTFFRPGADSRLMLEIRNEAGCVAKDEVLVKVIIPVFVPNAFSPNDDGVNDRLLVFASPSVQKILSFEVFDRWGGLLFRRTDLRPNEESDGWDGRSNGKPLSSGVYVWLARVELFDGAIENLSGEIILVR